ncbi:MAG: hypothetical protein KDB53_09345 [Planctomycetes bacterium]|nr:hypothetical protein [Planctomycetota bacterium]
MRNALIVLLSLGCADALAQLPATQGQLPAPDLQCAFAMMVPDSEGGFEIPAPYDEHIIGLYQGPNSVPAPVIDAHIGLLGFALPTGAPWIVGFEVTSVLYADSPGSAFYDFGARFTSPNHLNPALGRAGYGHQFLHLSDTSMWRQLRNDPSNYANWTSYGAAALSAPGGAPSTLFLPFGEPGRIYNDLIPHMSYIPPRHNPRGAGGALVGANIVIQLGVLDPNASAPPTAKFRLSNAIGIQMMAVPAVAIDIGPGSGSGGGNYGDVGSVHSLTVRNPSLSLKVELTDALGGRIEAPTRITSGSSISYTIPDGAVTGPISAKSRIATPTFTQPLVAVVTKSAPLPYLPGTPATFVLKHDAQGAAQFVTTVTTTLVPGTNTLNLPPSPFSGAYQVDVTIYPLDPITNQAGYGTPPPVVITAQPVVGTPTMPLWVPVLPVAPATVTQTDATISNLVGSQALNLDNTTNVPVPVLAEVVVHR